MKKFVKAAMIAGTLIGLSACAQPFSANVSRFQQMPAPQGQTFAILASDPAKANSLEFAQYASLVRGEMARVGYIPATGDSADLVVKLDYAVDQGRERVRRSANYYDPFYYDPFYYGSARSFYRPRIVRTRRGYRYVGGFYDPFMWGPGYGGFNDVERYVVFTSELDLDIERTANGQRLFEGTAMAQSRDNDLTYLVPNLVDAMFTGFPGNNAEKVRITLPPRERR
ncbi:MAG: DUF4136 domain-containing protein [Sphingomonadales bacterium]|nr:DUF4136 domain-containing protein [Sphingomonadales bacterium]